MTFEEYCRVKAISKFYSDNLKVKYLNDSDVMICNYLAQQLPIISGFEVVKGKSITLTELIDMSVSTLEVFGGDLSQKARSLIANIPIRNDSIYFLQFGNGISFSLSKNGDILKDSGKNCCVVIPKELFECSIYHFGHECCHILKDTNYSEYQCSYTLGEVIPIFYELLMLENNDLHARDLLKWRLSTLNDAKDKFLVGTEMMKIENVTDGVGYENGKGLYEYVRGLFGCYLTGFYYAIILYSLYKANRDKILYLVGSVLRKERTTLDILKELGIYGKIDDTFNEELNVLRKKI